MYTEYIITRQGQAVALLLPVDARAVESAIAQAGRQAAVGWEAYVRLAEQLHWRWPAERTTQEILDEIGR